MPAAGPHLVAQAGRLGNAKGGMRFTFPPYQEFRNRGGLSMKVKYEVPMLRSFTTEKNQGQHPCWPGSVAYGGQCGSGGVAGTSCVTGHTPFSS